MYATRVNLSVAIVCMINATAVQEEINNQQSAAANVTSLSNVTYVPLQVDSGGCAASVGHAVQVTHIIIIT